MSLRGCVRVYLGAIPGASVRAMAVALGEPPAAIQGACWAEGLEVPGLPDLQREAETSGRLLVLPPHVTAYARLPT